VVVFMTLKFITKQASRSTKKSSSYLPFILWRNQHCGGYYMSAAVPTVEDGCI